ncbi:MAG: calcium/sodium antiporter [Lentisphaeria bacterium]|nr:calcium/sodium antiporter [Lentisphaeria bacterium]
MIVSILQGVVGLVLLYYGAEYLIRGGVSIARKFNVSPLLIGLTLVAFGTSAPELVVSIDATWHGHGDISLGNVIGSNICNIALILGLSAAIAPIPVNKQLLKLDIWIMLGSAAAFTGFYRISRGINRWEAAILLLSLLGYTGWRFFHSGQGEDPPGEGDIPQRTYPVGIALLLTAGGLAGLIGGAKLLVISAVAVAKAMHVPEAVIGLTIVALGTSLPELATSVVAALKREHDIAIGNVVGSNIFNILCIVGIVPLIRPIDAPGISPVDLWLMLGISAALLPIMATGMKISRREGVLLLLVYIGYMVYLFHVPGGAQS